MKVTRERATMKREIANIFVQHPIPEPLFFVTAHAHASADAEALRHPLTIAI